MNSQQKLSCILVDDDKMALLILQSLVGKTDFLDLIGVFDNPIDAINVLSEKNVDLVFLDVEMPELSGLELIENLEHKTQIILTTSKAQYAVDGFDYDVADFLLKPIHNYSRFLKAVRKARSNSEKSKKAAALNNVNGNHIFVKVDSLLLNFNLEDILWIEASGDYVKICTEDKPYMVHSKLRTMEEKLPSAEFVRIHRSFMVRVDRIKNIDNANLQVGSKIIPVSNSYRNNLMSRINTLT